jgi:hypothetical protein
MPPPLQPPPPRHVDLTREGLEPVVRYFCGLDLGQSQDFSCLCILEQTTDPLPPKPARLSRDGVVVESGALGRTITVAADPPHISRLRDEGGRGAHRPTPSSTARYALRHIRRWDLGTKYTDIVEEVVKLFDTAPLSWQTLVIDQTGVGLPVVDMFVKARPRCQVRPITITAGSLVTVVGTGWHVAKKELVSVLQVLLQSGRLKVARSLPLAGVLIKELEDFRVKITAAANESYEAWRERAHDDLVLATGLAAWVAERGIQRYWIR